MRGSVSVSLRTLGLATGLFLFALAFLASNATALRLHEVARFNQPVYVTAAPGDSRDLFVVERAGRIQILRHGHKLDRPFLDIHSLVDLDFPNNQFRDQGGLVSLAFAPDYRTSGRFYVFYTHRNNQAIHIDEFRRSRQSRDRASIATGRTIIATSRHGKRKDLGGHLEFGPDGLLYVGFGYGRDPDSAQDPSALTGKILRFEPTSSDSAAHPQIFASGLRMPWRFSFDPATGDLIVGDVGDERFEEVDLLTPADTGANLGWPFFEGPSRHDPGGPAGLKFPVLSKSHHEGFCAIVGGYLLRGQGIPSLRNRYVYGDVCSGMIRSAKLGLHGSTGDRSEHLAVPSLVSFGRDAKGRLYTVGIDGSVYRVSR